MTPKRLILFAWFPAAIFVLAANLFMLMTYGRSRELARLNAESPVDTSFHLTASAATSQVLNATVIAGDARALLVSSFLKNINSPMMPYADHIVAEADKYNIDYTLVPAIAMCESQAGKHMPKKNEYNFAGIAVATGTNKGKAFTSWTQAISWVTNYIKTQYFDRGITDLHDIGGIWAPPSVQTGYSWTNCVEYEQNLIKYNHGSGII